MNAHASTPSGGSDRVAEAVVMMFFLSRAHKTQLQAFLSMQLNWSINMQLYIYLIATPFPPPVIGSHKEKHLTPPFTNLREMMATVDFEDIMRDAIDKGATPRGVVASRKAGVLPDAKPLTLQSTFWITSCTKLLTAIACLQCVEQGLFSLNSPNDVTKLLPEYAHPEILIGQSYDETSREQNYIAADAYPLNGMGHDLNYIPRLIARRKGRNEAPRAFREEWEYGAGADWVGAMVERASGLKVSAFMQKHIWEPLSIKCLTFHVESNEMVREHLVSFSARNPDTNPLEHPPDSITANPAPDAMGGAGVYGSLVDYAAVLGSILKDDGKLLNSDSVEEERRPHLSEASKRLFM
ncbi:hypothetical protein HWV62_38787 [Athelia sp. TMB]|nr:hypothetical protein HWV62_38787 [Athelia sp. TMB]